MKLYFAVFFIILSCTLPEETSEDTDSVITGEKGKDGENGKDGSGCSIEKIPSIGYRIYCDDGTEGIINNGKDGKEGPAGRNGTSGRTRLPKMFVCQHDINHLSITHEKKITEILSQHVGVGHEFDVIGTKCVNENVCECDNCPDDTENFSVDIKFKHR